MTTLSDEKLATVCQKLRDELEVLNDLIGEVITLRINNRALLEQLDKKAIRLSPGEHIIKSSEPIGYLVIESGAELKVDTIVCEDIDKDRIIGPRPLRT